MCKKRRKRIDRLIEIISKSEVSEKVGEIVHWLVEIQAKFEKGDRRGEIVDSRTVEGT